MRTAAILGLGFLAVFVVSLVAAPGSDGPPRSTTRLCGPYVAPGPRQHRYVAYATRIDCDRARRVALAYRGAHVCRRASLCRAVVDGLNCRYAGSAGRRLGWMACGRSRRVQKPRVFFSVDRSGPAGGEAPDAPALPS